MKNFVRLSEIDNVVTVTAELDSGIEVEQVKTSGLVPCSHKIATAEIRQGEAVQIAKSLAMPANIRPGEHVHTHNVNFRNASADYEFATDLKPVDVVCLNRPETPLWAIARKNGKEIGT